MKGRDVKAVKLKNFDIETYAKERAEEAVKMYIEDGYIILNFAYPYEIEMSRCNTPGKILGWINQLSHKNWMNAERLSRFAQLAFGLIGIEIDYRI